MFRFQGAYPFFRYCPPPEGIEEVFRSILERLGGELTARVLQRSSDRVEFSIGQRGWCEVRRVRAEEGIDYIDVLFEESTLPKDLERVIEILDAYLSRGEDTVRPWIGMKCQECGQAFEDSVLRKRIGGKCPDVLCPTCEMRRSIASLVWANHHTQAPPGRAVPPTQTGAKVHRSRSKGARGQVVASDTGSAASISILHLSDLHFEADTPVEARLQWLLQDVKKGESLGLQHIDYLVISGDFTHKGSAAGFQKACQFLRGLKKSLGVSDERCIIVPGNHDIRDTDEVFRWVVDAKGGNVKIQNEATYPQRIDPFSKELYREVLGKSYPTDYADQGIVTSFWEHGLQFLTLNSCWRIDKENRKAACLCPEAVASVVRKAEAEEQVARARGKLSTQSSPLRIAVWHHAVGGRDAMSNLELIENLQNLGVKIVLHGDVHELRRDQFRPWKDYPLYVVGAGAFGSSDRPESTPRMYNLLAVHRKLRTVRVHARRQDKPDGEWKGWYEWPRSDGLDGKLSYYDIDDL